MTGSALSIGSAPVSVFERRMWLARAVQHLRSYCREYGLPLPERLTVTVGTTQVIDGRYALGKCWPSRSTAERVPGIVIYEGIEEPVLALSTLLHELIHAADDCVSQRGPWFAAWARAVGLLGLPSTYAGPALERRLRSMANSLGPYPKPQYGFVVYPSGRVRA